MGGIRGFDRRRWVRVVAAVGLVMAMTALAGSSAQAQSPPDLQSIVIGNLSGYEVAPPGDGLSGPLTKEQMVHMGMGPEVAQALDSSEFRTYARTFLGPEGQVAVILAFDCGFAFKARIFGMAERKGAGDLGTVTGVSGLDDAYRVAVSPAKADGMSAQQVFFRSGQLAFHISMMDRPSPPVTGPEILEVAYAQAAVVPPGVGRTGEGAADMGFALGRVLVYGIVFVLAAVLIVLLAVVLTSRGRRRDTPPPWSPQPPSTPSPPWI